MSDMAIDAALGEVLQPNEEQLAQEIAATVAANIQRGPRPALRDAHPRAHGCVQASFRVDDGLPPHLAQGVFVPGKSYPALIRFSNGNPETKLPDIIPDVRGMAIKLLGVPGDKLLDDERETQDFVLISHPVFFLDSAKDYLTFFRRIFSSNLLIRKTALLALSARGLINFFKMNIVVASPLETRYWSVVAYRLGAGPHKQAVKYSARPRPFPGSTALPVPPTPHFLRETMIRHLEAGEAHFDFLVQPRKSPAMSVENSMVEWKEEDAPFIRVATITIPRQQFATAERDQLGENLSFSPWHALPAHRPLGAVNRVRRVVYQAISKVRHDLNGAPRREPSA